MNGEQRGELAGRGAGFRGSLLFVLFCFLTDGRVQHVDVERGRGVGAGGQEAMERAGSSILRALRASEAGHGSRRPGQGLFVHLGDVGLYFHGYCSCMGR